MFICLCCAYAAGDDPDGIPCGYFALHDIRKHVKPLSNGIPNGYRYETMISGDFTCEICLATIQTAYRYTLTQ